ncbi:MAG: TrkH family potassium uptake protein, partial [Myxococcales bacterium]|nr:TrkH family potassium uptake protein [Myxococcales bacterium]
LLAGLQLTQSMDLGVAVFEAVSALATVGLSIGGTAQLDEVGKVLIMFAMFAGRVGPLTLFLFLSEQKGDELWKHPEEEVDVG